MKLPVPYDYSLKVSTEPPINTNEFLVSHTWPLCGPVLPGSPLVTCQVLGPY